MEEILKQTLLYDFYGELLTEHQKQVYEDVILNDYSLSEVAPVLASADRAYMIWSAAAAGCWRM